jgi:acetyl-CoA C-acetyltransferase
MLFDQTAIDKYLEIERINHVHHAGNIRNCWWRFINVSGSKERRKIGFETTSHNKMGAVIGSEPLIMKGQFRH